MPKDVPHPEWNSPLRMAVGASLLAVHPTAKTAQEIASATDRDASNVRQGLKAMVGDGLLVTLDAPLAVGPGRKANAAYALQASAIDGLRAMLNLSPEPGILRPGQEIVFADSSAAEDVAHVLSDATLVAGAQWAVRAVGNGSDYGVAFEGIDAAAAAEELAAALAAAGIATRRMHVAEVLQSSQLLARSEATVRAAQRSRLSRQTRSGSRTAP